MKNHSQLSLKNLKKIKISKVVTVVKYILTIGCFCCIIIIAGSLATSYIDRSTLSTSLNTELTKILEEQGSKAQQFLKKKEDVKDFKVIYEKNLFGPLVHTANLPPPPPPVQKPVSKIPLSLVGTFIFKDEEPSAIIEDQKKGVQDAFVLNEVVFGEAKLKAIYSDRVEIERSGQIEVLKLDNEAGGSSSASAVGGGDVVMVDEGEVDAALANLPVLLTNLRAVPYFKDGQAVGLRLFAIKAGSIFEKIGLRNGDILKSINGNSLGDFSQAVKLFEQLKSERNLKVSLERNREEKEVRYQIK
jgi:general secretion pathway protein C